MIKRRMLTVVAGLLVALSAFGGAAGAAAGGEDCHHPIKCHGNHK